MGEQIFLVMGRLTVRNFQIFGQILNPPCKNLVFFPQEPDCFLILDRFFLKFIDKIIHVGDFRFQRHKTVFCFFFHNHFPAALAFCFSMVCLTRSAKSLFWSLLVGTLNAGAPSSSLTL